MHEEKRKGEIQMTALEKAEKIKLKNCETEKGRNKEQMVLCKKNVDNENRAFNR